eukprot:scaffold7417_cov258-Pinguiococcus_pyrenoidosus.AAC.7
MVLRARFALLCGAVCHRPVLRWGQRAAALGLVGGALYASSASSAAAWAAETGFLGPEAAKALDEELMGDYGFTLEQLMELAGLSVAAAVREAYPSGKKVALLCGPGNNGGDGLVAARHLKFFGYEPVVYYPKSGQNEHYAKLLTQLRSVGVPVLTDAEPELATFDVAVDALFGFGFKGTPREPFASLLERLAAAQEDGAVKVLSVDVPSGWDVELGPTAAGAKPLRPDTLVSLTAPKLASKHFTGARHFVGGRFLPEGLGVKYNIAMPRYKGASQIAEIASPSSDTALVDPDEFVAVYVTAPNEEVAELIANEVVTKRLAACVNVTPKVVSMYFWDGGLQKDEESMMMIKTRKSLVSALTAAVVELHPYDVPEVIATPLVGGNRPYFDFVRGETQN